MDQSHVEKKNRVESSAKDEDVSRPVNKNSRIKTVTRFLFDGFRKAFIENLFQFRNIRKNLSHHYRDPVFIKCIQDKMPNDLIDIEKTVTSDVLLANNDFDLCIYGTFDIFLMRHCEYHHDGGIKYFGKEFILCDGILQLNRVRGIKIIGNGTYLDMTNYADYNTHVTIVEDFGNEWFDTLKNICSRKRTITSTVKDMAHFFVIVMTGVYIGDVAWEYVEKAFSNVDIIIIKLIDFDPKTPHHFPHMVKTDMNYEESTSIFNTRDGLRLPKIFPSLTDSDSD